MLTETEKTLNTFGNRFKYLRNLAELNADELAKAALVGRSTIFYWEAIEEEKPSSITSRSIYKVLDAIRKRGVECTEQWLLTGSGTPPYKLSDDQNFLSDYKISETIITPSAKSSREQEIQLFISANKLAVTTQITHNCLAPIFEKGDFVGGIWQPSQSLTGEKICIVTIKNKLQIRKVKKGTAERVFDLSYISYDTNSTEPFELKNYSLEQLAPIIRLWR